jgi:hypothetical protein
MPGRRAAPLAVADSDRVCYWCPVQPEVQLGLRLCERSSDHEEPVALELGSAGDDGGIALQQIVCVEPSERADGRAVADGQVVTGRQVVARDQVEEPEQLLFPVGADLLT